MTVLFIVLTSTPGHRSIFTLLQLVPVTWYVTELSSGKVFMESDLLFFARL